MHLRLVFTGLLAAVIALATVGASAPQRSHPSEHHHRKEVQVIAPVGNMPDALAATETSREAFYAEEQRKIDEYLAWQHEQDVAAAQREWALTHPAPPRSTSTPGSGDCAPVAAVVGWGTVQRESGGNPFIVNGSDHRGCAQISGGWWAGACSHLNWQDVNDQAACARIILQLQGPSAWAGTYSP